MALSQTRTAQGLGWLSLGLGAAAIAFPSSLTRLAGLSDSSTNRDLLRAVGLRELACGLGLLTGGRAEPWLWGRLAGDAMDMALLAGAWASDQGGHRRTGAALAAVAGIAALDGWAVLRQRRNEPVTTIQTITIARSPAEVYGFWRTLSNLPRFMTHLESVEQTGGLRSHWRVKGPANVPIEWDAEITDDRPGRLLAWQSLDGADIPNRGEVRFETAPGGRGTVVRVDLRYQPPGGRLGAAFARLLGREPGQEAHQDLRRLKQVLETGEVARSDASIHAGLHPARPPTQWRSAP